MYVYSRLLLPVVTIWPKRRVLGFLMKWPGLWGLYFFLSVGTGERILRRIADVHDRGKRWFE
jgi:hypothetical protein